LIWFDSTLTKTWRFEEKEEQQSQVKMYPPPKKTKLLMTRTRGGAFLQGKMFAQKKKLEPNPSFLHSEERV
jgi:hypothetical protein